MNAYYPCLFKRILKELLLSLLLDLPNLQRNYFILIHVTSCFVPFLSVNLHSMRELGSQSHFFEDKICKSMNDVMTTLANDTRMYHKDKDKYTSAKRIV